jgi:hypothetical protein
MKMGSRLDISALEQFKTAAKVIDSRVQISDCMKLVAKHKREKTPECYVKSFPFFTEQKFPTSDRE